MYLRSKLVELELTEVVGINLDIVPGIALVVFVIVLA
jgi:hypothetical protein